MRYSYRPCASFVHLWSRFSLCFLCKLSNRRFLIRHGGHALKLWRTTEWKGGIPAAPVTSALQNTSSQSFGRQVLNPRELGDTSSQWLSRRGVLSKTNPLLHWKEMAVPNLWFSGPTPISACASIHRAISVHLSCSPATA